MKMELRLVEHIRVVLCIRVARLFVSALIVAFVSTIVASTALAKASETVGEMTPQEAARAIELFKLENIRLQGIRVSKEAGDRQRVTDRMDAILRRAGYSESGLSDLMATMTIRRFPLRYLNGSCLQNEGFLEFTSVNGIYCMARVNTETDDTGCRAFPGKEFARFICSKDGQRHSTVEINY